MTTEQTPKYETNVSDERLDIILSNECAAPPGLATSRFRRLANEIADRDERIARLEGALNAAPTAAPVPLAEQIDAVQHVMLMADRSPSYDAKHEHHKEALRSALTTLQQHERAMAVVEAARRARKSMRLLIQELSEPGTEALAAEWELGHVLAALAEQMNDRHAKAVLNSAAFDLGNEIREGRVPTISDTDREPELPANEAVAATSAELAYIQTRNRHRLFTVVHGELERCGISEPTLAARLRISEGELNRLLRTPDCWTPDTASRILFAASGATLSYELTYPRWRSKAVPRTQSATPAGKGEPNVK